MTAFRDRPETKKGNAGERVVAGYLKAHGFGVLASYDYCGVDGDKAPRLMFEVGGLVVPDLDHAKAMEAKKMAEEAMVNRGSQMDYARAQAELAEAIAQLAAIDRLRKQRH